MEGYQIRGLMESYLEVYQPSIITEEVVQQAADMWVEACIAYGIDFSEYTLDELTESFIVDMSSEELSESVLNEILGMPGAQNLGASLRKQYGKARRAVGDVAGATNQGYIGQKTTSKNPLARAGNQFTRNLSAVPRAAASFGAGFLTGKSGATKSTSKSSPSKPAKEGDGKPKKTQLSHTDLYDLVKGYLLDEGFASTEQSADKIILNMSEAWFADIMEITGGKGHPGYKAGSKDHGDLEDHPAVKKGGVLSPRYGNHLGDMDDEDEDEDDLESVVKQQSRDRRETVRKPLRDKVKAARKKMKKEEVELVDEARNPEVEEKGKKVGEYERAGKYQGITSKFRKEHPGSREAKKEKGRKQTEGELEQERIKIRNARVAKYGFTKKEKKESKAREKYDSPRD